MAVINADVDDAARRLARWFAERGPADDTAVSDVIVPQAAGFSMTTILFRATPAGGEPLELVARVAPPDGASLFEDPDLEREFTLLKALGDGDLVPVAKVRWLEPDAAWLGSPFVIMDRVAGEVPADDPP